MVSNEFLLTTVDNPYNPWTDWDLWYAYDERMGYHTCSYLARVIVTDDSYSEAEEDEAYNDAANEIIKYDPFGIYVKVSSTDATPLVSTTQLK